MKDQLELVGTGRFELPNNSRRASPLAGLLFGVSASAPTLNLLECFVGRQARVYRAICFSVEEKEWSALADDLRTFMQVQGSEEQVLNV